MNQKQKNSAGQLWFTECPPCQALSFQHMIPDSP